MYQTVDNSAGNAHPLSFSTQAQTYPDPTSINFYLDNNVAGAIVAQFQQGIGSCTSPGNVSPGTGSSASYGTWIFVAFTATYGSTGAPPPGPTAGAALPIQG